MNTYILRIMNKQTGCYFEDTFTAMTLGIAMQIAEARYGSGCVLGCVG